MVQVRDVCNFLDAFAPPKLAESWDNVGLILGDPQRPCQKIMTCLTVTDESAQEAIADRADLIVSHHPLPFRPLQKITTEETPSRLVWQLANAGISVYSPHTAFDSAAQGINAELARLLGLVDVAPLSSDAVEPAVGSGRRGRLPQPVTLGELATAIRAVIDAERIEANFPREKIVKRVGIACGSGGSLLSLARQNECDCFVTGEATFHTILEAAAQGIALVQIGHYASERFGIEMLANQLHDNFTDCDVWASRRETSCRNWL
ncbi:MAG: Nif3-like dinuclear metal center hexameric protein [Pirellulaceae bacterium]